MGNVVQTLKYWLRSRNASLCLFLWACVGHCFGQSCPNYTITTISSGTAAQVIPASANTRTFVCSLYYTGTVPGAPITGTFVALYTGTGSLCNQNRALVDNLPFPLSGDFSLARDEHQYIPVPGGLCINAAGVLNLQVQVFYGTDTGAGAQQVTVTSTTGGVRYPDGSLFSGYLTLQLTRSSVRNICTTPTQVLTLKTIKVLISNGTLGTMSVYPTPCLSPSQPYLVQVYETDGTQMYRANWTIPNSGAGQISITAIH